MAAFGETMQLLLLVGQRSPRMSAVPGSARIVAAPGSAGVSTLTFDLAWFVAAWVEYLSGGNEIRLRWRAQNP
jgi:hypothetical protein